MTDTSDRRDLRSSIALSTLFAVIALLVGIDLALDLRGGTTAAHAAVEGTVVAIGLAAAIRFALRVRMLASETRDLRQHATDLGQRLAASEVEAARWRSDAKELLAGVGAAIDRQLERWALTEAEKDVARLLLKGLSHKEIAGLRDVSETTVRHQARALYRKAGLSGRSDLTAFFLEDLLAPQAPHRAETDNARIAAGAASERTSA
jgi:DNA-binding CsgD family transcriptional regulator